REPGGDRGRTRRRRFPRAGALRVRARAARAARGAAAGVGRAGVHPKTRSAPRLAREPAGRSARRGARLRGVRLLLQLAVDAVAGVRQRVQPLEADRLAAVLADPEVGGILVEPPKRFLDAVEVASLLAGEEQHLLALHRVR